MTRSPLHFRRLQSGGLITNYYCSSQCRHCLYCSSPRWPKHYLKPDVARSLMKTIQTLGCGSVHIGGGEPFLDPDGLLAVLETALDLGMGIDYVETNASWCVDVSKAVDLLKACRKRGLRTLLISISPFHNEFIPFIRVKRLMVACGDAGINIFPWIEDFQPDLDHFDPNHPHPLEEYQQTFGSDYLRRIPQRYWIHYGGRAALFFGKVLGRRSARSILQTSDRPCYELEDTSHFHMDLYGRFIPGLCAGLAVESGDLGRPLSKSKYPVMTTLHEKGPRGLFQWAHDDMGYRPDREFLNKCDLCLDIRCWLVQTARHSFPELHPRFFYEEWNRFKTDSGS